jgi:hypothetical protein
VSGIVARMTSRSAPGALADLLRWVAAGGTWRLAHVVGDTVTVHLLTCDGGELQGVIGSDEPAFRAYVADHCQDQP